MSAARTAILEEAVHSGKVSDEMVQNWLYQFESHYLRVDYTNSKGRVILWPQGSGTGKTYTALTMGSVIPSFYISLGPRIDKRGDAPIPRPDATILDWLEETGDGAYGAAEIIGALVGAIYRNLTCYCIKILSRGSVQVEEAKVWTRQGSRQVLDEALDLVKPYMEKRSVSEIAYWTHRLNRYSPDVIVGPVPLYLMGHSVTRQGMLEAIVREADCALIGAQDLLKPVLTMITDHNRACEYIDLLNIEHSINSFMKLIDMTKDGLSSHLVDETYWRLRKCEIPYQPRPMQSIIVIDNIAYLDQYLSRISFEELTDTEARDASVTGIVAAKWFYFDLLSYSIHYRPQGGSRGENSWGGEGNSLISKRGIDRVWLCYLSAGFEAYGMNGNYRR